MARKASPPAPAATSTSASAWTASAVLLAAGAAVAGVHILGGFLLTPFFGASPRLWAHVVGSLLGALSAGLLLGRFLRGYGWCALACVGGLSVAATPLSTAPIARSILDRSPDAAYAPALVVLLLITLPGLLACSVLPGAIGRARHAGAGLVTLAIGALVGAAICTPALEADGERFAWMLVVGLGAGLAAAGALSFSGVLRLLAGTVVAVGVAGAAVLPCEVRTYDFEKALALGWRLPLGRYYLTTANSRALEATEVLARFRALGSAPGTDDKVAAVLVAETLTSVGPVRMTGEGLRRILDIYLPEESKPLVMPFIDRIESLRSDGLGAIFVSLRWDDGEDTIRVAIPDRDGGELRFLFTGDPQLHVRVDAGLEETVTTISVGPTTVEQTGFFGSSERIRTPVKVVNAVLFFDAYLQQITVRDRRDRVSVSVRGQGKLGSPSEKVIQVVDR